MTKNIGIFNGNWKNGERLTLADVPFVPTELEALEIEIHVADTLIALGLPEVGRVAQQRKDKAVARRNEIVAEQMTGAHNAHELKG